MGLGSFLGSELTQVVKAWVGEMPRTPYISTETIAHGMMSCDCGSTCGIVICLRLTVEKDWL